MLKKVTIMLLVVMVLSSVAFCATPKKKTMSIGLDQPMLGWLQSNDKGEIEANLGINLGLGISYKRYFEPLKAGQFNTYWSAGTFVLVFPYVGIGGDYVWDNGWYLGGGLIYIIPEIHGGFMF